MVMFNACCGVEFMVRVQSSDFNYQTLSEDLARDKVVHLTSFYVYANRVFPKIVRFEEG